VAVERDNNEEDNSDKVDKSLGDDGKKGEDGALVGETIGDVVGDALADEFEEASNSGRRDDKLKGFSAGASSSGTFCLFGDIGRGLPSSPVRFFSLSLIRRTRSLMCDLSRSLHFPLSGLSKHLELCERQSDILLFQSLVHFFDPAILSQCALTN